MTWAGVVAARAVRLDPASPCPCWPWHPGQCRDVVPVPVWQRFQPVPHWTSVTGELCWELEWDGCPSPLAQRGRFMLCRCWVLLPSSVLELHPELVSAHPSPCQPPAVVQHQPSSSWAFPTASLGSARCLQPPELPLPMCCPQPAPLRARVGHCPLKQKAAGCWWRWVTGVWLVARVPWPWARLSCSPASSLPAPCAPGVGPAHSQGGFVGAGSP